MLRKFTLRSLGFAFLLVTCVVATPVIAQRVWVGGGGVRIRAPFVRVDVGPYGGVSVRAPFTAVDVPPDDFYYADPAYGPVIVRERVVEPALPTGDEMAAMSDAQLNSALQSLAERLHNRLRRFNTGQTWQQYLRLPEVVVDAAASSEDRQAALIRLEERFQRVSADPQYSMIAGLSEFLAMQSAVSIALSRPAGTVTPPQPSTEELPLPAPERPNPPLREGRDRPFLRPAPRAS